MKNPADEKLNINVRLLRRIQKTILTYPEAFSMESFTGTEKPMEFDPKKMKAPTCGSACCIAGWAVTLGDKEALAQKVKEDENFSVSARAAQLLGLTIDQRCGMFYFEGESGDLALVSAQEAAAMIDQFIADPSMFE